MTSRRRYCLRRCVGQTRSFSDLVSAAESGRCLHQTLIEARPSLSTAVVMNDDRPGNHFVPSSVPSHSVGRAKRQLVAGCGEGQTTRSVYRCKVERDGDPINRGGRAGDVTGPAMALAMCCAAQFPVLGPSCARAICARQLGVGLPRPLQVQACARNLAGSKGTRCLRMA